MSVMRSLLLLMLIVLVTPLSAVEGDPARDALRTQAPPWYDAKADDWQRIAARAPDAPKVRDSSDGLDVPSGIGSLFSWLMIALVVMATAWLIWQLVRNLVSERGAPVAEVRRAAVARAVADLSALPFADSESVKDPEAALERAIAERDWRRAVAWSYALHLVELDHAGALRVAKGTTNRGYLRMLASWAEERATRRTLTPLLNDAVSTFERTWFGHHPADQTLVQTLELGRLRLHEALSGEKPA
jgi:hypothetical protein